MPKHQVVTFVVAALLQTCALAQSAKYVAPPTPYDIPLVELKASSQRDLTMPDIDWYGGPQCDANGNAYLHAAANINDGVVVKLDTSRDDAVIFQWNDNPRELAFMEFSVNASGDVFMLGQGKDAIVVVAFGSDGREVSRSRVDVSPKLWPTLFAMYPDQSFVLGGYYMEGAPKNLEGTAFVGLFDRSGRLRYPIKDKSLKVVPKEARLAPKDTSAIIGIDGNAYILRPQRVQVVSPLGEIVREVPFSKPDPKGSATQLWVSGNRIAIQFLIPRADGKLSANFLVLDSTSGVPVGLYKSSSELGFLLCFRGSSFFFEKSRQGRMTTVTANLP